MASTLVKICGLGTSETLEAAIAARAQYCGFVFFEASPRNLSFETARQLADQAAGRIGTVGVFVNPDDDLLNSAVAAGKLDVLQLHKVTPKRRTEIAQRFGLPVWAVVPVTTRGDLDAVAPAEGSGAERILYDAATRTGSALPGGMGVRFDWKWLHGRTYPYAWGLAGGLSAANVAEAIAITGAPLVDTSSGVESAPGIKDVDKIAAFCKAAFSA